MSFASTLEENQAMSHPALPEPAHADQDSMLSRKFGHEVANYFSGSPLNRVSFLRADHTFLTHALNHPTTRFLLFRSLQPLVTEAPASSSNTAPSPTSDSNPSQTPTHTPAAASFISSAPYALAKATLSDVQPLIGPNPYSKPEKDLMSEYNSTITIPQLIFLGLDASTQSSDSTTTPADTSVFQWRKGGADAKPGAEVYTGHPLFALDVTPPTNPSDPITSAAEAVIKAVETDGREFLEGRMLLGFEAGEASTYANARHLLDWNARNPFCAGCGQPTMSTNGGHKRTCPPRDAARLQGSAGAGVGAEPSAERADCATRHGVSNLCFPRTDPTVIMAVVSSDGGKILLGRQKRFPPYWYSTLAGFLEPGESVEEAVRREVWEEAGVRLGRVVLHSTQPWPYPANLMIGAIGQAIPSGETIDLGNDPELEDAKWYTMDEVRHALKYGASGLGEKAPEKYKEGGLRLPPATAIANLLMDSLVNGFAAGNGKL